MLTDASIEGKIDRLLGLKENVIIGKLIPAATGLKRYRTIEIAPTEPIVREAYERDTLLQALEEIEGHRPVADVRRATSSSRATAASLRATPSCPRSTTRAQPQSTRARPGTSRPRAFTRRQARSPTLTLWDSRRIRAVLLLLVAVFLPGDAAAREARTAREFPVFDVGGDYHDLGQANGVHFDLYGLTSAPKPAMITIETPGRLRRLARPPNAVRARRRRGRHESRYVQGRVRGGAPGAFDPTRRRPDAPTAPTPRRGGWC